MQLAEIIARALHLLHLVWRVGELVQRCSGTHSEIPLLLKLTEVLFFVETFHSRLLSRWVFVLPKAAARVRAQRARASMHCHARAQKTRAVLALALDHRAFVPPGVERWSFEVLALGFGVRGLGVGVWRVGFRV